MTRARLVPVRDPRRKATMLAQLERDLGDGTGRLATPERPTTAAERVALAEERARAAERAMTRLEGRAAELERATAPGRTRADPLGDAPIMRALLGRPEVVALVPPRSRRQTLLLATEGHEQIRRLLGVRDDDSVA